MPNYSTCQVEDIQDSAMKFPSVGKRRRDSSRYKKGGIGPLVRASPFLGQLVEEDVASKVLRGMISMLII
jgi:hypothetical protein